VQENVTPHGTCRFMYYTAVLSEVNCQPETQRIQLNLSKIIRNRKLFYMETGKEGINSRKTVWYENVL
jgi:hypothetical protein